MENFRRNDNINVLKNIIEIFSILIILIIVGIAVHSYILLLINILYLDDDHSYRRFISISLNGIIGAHLVII